MAKKVKDTQYIVLSTMLRSRETKMVNRDRAERMLAESGFADAARILTECGYEDMSEYDSAAINEALEKHRAAQILEIADMVPQKAVVDLFRLKYDYHNAKVLVKAGALGDATGNRAANSDSLLSNCARSNVAALRRAYETGENPELSSTLTQAIEQAKVALARTGSPQTADFILDKAYFAEMSALAEEIGDKYVSGYVQLLIDSANVRTAVRVLSSDAKLEKLTMALIPGGSVDPAAIQSAMDSRDSLAALFAGSPFAEVVPITQMTAFEKAADNVVNAYLADSERIAFGPAVVLGYLAAVENEIQTIRIILGGRLTGIDSRLLRERLRDSYV